LELIDVAAQAQRKRVGGENGRGAAWGRSWCLFIGSELWEVTGQGRSMVVDGGGLDDLKCTGYGS
jgi:hypothetical protein